MSSSKCAFLQPVSPSAFQTVNHSAKLNGLSPAGYRKPGLLRTAPSRRVNVNAVLSDNKSQTETAVNTASANVPSLNLITSMDQFWEFADEAKLNTQYESDKGISFLKEASLEEVKKVCLQYRYFVYDYPNNLSYLVSKLPYGVLKSLLGEILSEELGSGKKCNAHIVWYDNFLRSLGISDEEMRSSLYPENAQILKEIEEHCSTRPYEHVVGVIGMGGECLCQIYLTNMHKYLVQNSAMKELGRKVDWHFWNYHIGEEDIKHRELVRKAINEAAVDEDGLRELTIGYAWGKSTWDQFWRNNYKETRAASL